MPTLRSLSGPLVGNAIVVSISSEGALLDVVVDVHGPTTKRIRVRFEELVGYRVLDERDLPQFWHSAQNQGARQGCGLYEVTSGGWADDHEAQSPVMAAGAYPQLREWIVSSEDWCVSVLSQALEDPCFTER